MRGIKGYPTKSGTNDVSLSFDRTFIITPSPGGSPYGTHSACAVGAHGCSRAHAIRTGRGPGGGVGVTCRP